MSKKWQENLDLANMDGYFPYKDMYKILKTYNTKGVEDTKTIAEMANEIKEICKDLDLYREYL